MLNTYELTIGCNEDGRIVRNYNRYVVLADNAKIACELIEKELRKEEESVSEDVKISLFIDGIKHLDEIDIS